jgi:hypothetical protein
MKKTGFYVWDLRFSTAVWLLKSSVFWDIAPCRLLKLNRRFGGTCRKQMTSRAFRLFTFLDLFFHGEGIGDMFLRNVGRLSPDYGVISVVAGNRLDNRGIMLLLSTAYWSFLTANPRVPVTSPRSKLPALHLVALPPFLYTSSWCSCVIVAERTFHFLVSWGGVRLSPLGTSATVRPIVPASDDDECGAVGGMRIGRGNRSTRRKPDPVQLCPPQIPHGLTWNPGRRGGKPRTNRLSYDTAIETTLVSV